MSDSLLGLMNLHFSYQVTSTVNLNSNRFEETHRSSGAKYYIGSQKPLWEY